MIFDFRRFVLAFAIPLALVCMGCGGVPGQTLPDESTAPIDPARFELVARFAHLSDAQILDEESPARLATFADLSMSAWRPQEAYTTQLLDGAVRAVNKTHAYGETIHFAVHTGDALDNAQFNELQWFMTCMNGGLVDPRSGPDDRNPATLPSPLLDPHHPFEAQGLYRNGVHGDRATIPWYAVFGNHDRYAVGVFPIIVDNRGHATTPLPANIRLPLFFPASLDPTGSLSWGLITPGNPGPPIVPLLPVSITADADRRYISTGEWIAAHLDSTGTPPGHGFNEDAPERTWFSAAVAPGVRLISLNTSDAIIEQPRLVHSEGAISFQQLLFLRNELRAAETRGDVVIVATHHPSLSLDITLGTALTAATMIDLLNSYPSVKLHIAGHWHSHAAFDRGGYAELVTGSLVDAPQQGRVVELWRDRADPGRIELRYRFLSHLDEIEPLDGSIPRLDDPMLPMRRIAAELAGVMVR